MTVIRVGTRGSDLAVMQTDWVCEHLREADPRLVLEQVQIKTPGDLAVDQDFGVSWPVGAFVSALESALIERRIELAVHSYKDLPTEPTAGLTVAATPVREAPHDVLLTQDDIALEELPDGARIGTNSPRRAAQILRMGSFEIVPIRGNVPTRITKMSQQGLDGILLAAAGLKRLGIVHPHTIELPPDRFLPAPAQGALAVQVREGSAAEQLVAVLDNATTRATVTAERSFLREIGAGCHTPAGALATVDGETITLRARLFSDDYAKDVTDTEAGTDPTRVGVRLARRLKTQLAARQ